MCARTLWSKQPKRNGKYGKEEKENKEAYLMNKICSKIENINTTIFFMRNSEINESTVRTINSYNRIFGRRYNTMNYSLDILYVCIYLCVLFKRYRMYHFPNG